jgi:hypothetical protein
LYIDSMKSIVCALSARGYKTRCFCGEACRGAHQTARGRVERALAYGPRAAFNDLPRPGREPTITAEAKAWLADLVCRRAKEFG